jgi:hypothetical protein
VENSRNNAYRPAGLSTHKKILDEKDSTKIIKIRKVIASSSETKITVQQKSLLERKLLWTKAENNKNKRC